MTSLAIVEADAAYLAEDAAARARALDVRTSFLVQAPAGSGKTELLIQRYLALLAHVDEPEQIVAVTFTRKAAGEMRERVQRALAEARLAMPIDEPYEAKTRELAHAVLEQDARRGWELTDHPARLAIATFDALAVSLARRAPMSSALGPAPGYIDDASMLYRLAAAAAIAEAPADDVHWRALLAHCDNDAEQTANLLAGLLARRDQLLRTIRSAQPAEVRATLEVALAHEVNVSLRTLRSAFPRDAGREIAVLARFAAQQLAQDEATVSFAAALDACADHGDLPPATLDALPAWATLAQWLMTGRGSFRQQVTKKHGFPAPKRGDGEHKRRIDALLQRLAAVPGLAAALEAAARMPARARIGEASWRIVEALLHVFPRVVARLSLTFAAEGSVDFIQANLAALDALGDEEQPSDLLLRLDYRIQHLLVDEFQDTSATQLDLLVRLTSGWTPGDGRTLFAVGDPMQSIYRFREAEVRLFVEAQLAGRIAGLAVERLALRRNFRSQRHLVDWVNAKFPAVLGSVSDPVRGAVAFSAATAARPPMADRHVTLDLCSTQREEAETVVARVREALASGSTDIAILVRARGHLGSILPALRDAGIVFTAVELDTLGQRQAVQDLVSLAHALIQPCDRLAWLAVLRAPWCGLGLGDLFAIAEAAPPNARSIASLLGDVDAIAGLSDEGRSRAARVADVLRASIDAQGRAGVAERVRGAWLAIGGPACLVDPIDLEASERFFETLSQHERAGDVPAWQSFVDSLQHLYASPDAASGSSVQVMTMHKAKGLQFDTVVLPGLASKERGLDPALLRWRSRRSGLLIASSKARGGEHDPVYDFLCDIEEEEADSELARLLYVACTRAVSRLHLVASPGVKADKAGEPQWQPGSRSSLAKLWPVIAADAPAAAASVATGADAVTPLPLERLPLAHEVARPVDRLHARPMSAAIVHSPSFDWAAETARRIGTIAHRLLARIAEAGLDASTADRIAAFTARVRADLASAGFTLDELPVATARVLEAVQRTLSDPQGRWLFDPAHEEARSEWALAGVENGEIVHVVLDRTFVAGGTRWIVDFKTGTHEGGEVGDFLDREVERYREQLERYGRLVSGLDARPIRLALYYPLVEGGFREVPAASGVAMGNAAPRGGAAKTG